MSQSIRKTFFHGFATVKSTASSKINVFLYLMVFTSVTLLSACSGESNDNRTYEERLAQARQITDIGPWVLDETICHTAAFACNVQTLQYDPETDSVAAFYGSGLLLASNSLRARTITGVAPVVPETQATIYPYSPDGRFFNYSGDGIFDWVSGQFLPQQQATEVIDLTSSGASIGISDRTFYLTSDYGSRTDNYDGIVTDLNATQFDPNQHLTNTDEWLCVVETDTDFRVLVERQINANNPTSRRTFFELTINRSGIDSYTIIASDLPFQRYSPGSVCANTVHGVVYLLAGDNDLHVYTDGVLTTGTELSLSNNAIESYLGSYLNNWFGQANKLGFLLKDTFVMGSKLVNVPPNSHRVATDLRRLYVMTDTEGVIEIWSAPLIY